MKQVIVALVDALNGSTGAAPLAILARPKYPEREFYPCLVQDGSIMLKISKYGWEYKHRGTRPEKPPPANTEEIREALNASLPNGIAVKRITDEGTQISIIMEVQNEVSIDS